MGISWSKRHHHHHHHPNPPSLPLPPPPPPPPNPIIPSPPPQLLSSSPSPSPSPSPHPPSYAFAANAPHPLSFQPTFPSFPTHRPPPPHYSYSYTYSSFSRPAPPPPPPPQQYPYYVNVGGWGPSPAVPPPPRPEPAPYVDHQSAKKIKNDVNVHKDTIRIQADEFNPDCHLVSFTFDALVDGSITIFYFGKEWDHCTFTPLYPEIKPVKVPFQKGLGQKFTQPSGTGLDLGFFDMEDLSKPVPGEDVYPLVISAESSVPSTSADDQSDSEQLSKSSHRQISQAVLEKRDGENFQVKVMKQILWIDGVRYELREIFGISNSDEPAVNDLDSGKECVICMTEEKNTAVLPCRHMCMCSGCAKELRLQSDKCPVCRQPIKELLEIKVDEEST